MPNENNEWAEIRAVSRESDIATAIGNIKKEQKVQKTAKLNAIGMLMKSLFRFLSFSNAPRLSIYCFLQHNILQNVTEKILWCFKIVTRM